MRPEEKVEKKFVEECKKIGVKAFKFELKEIKGAPDRIIFLPAGMILFFEFKRPGGGKLSEHQEVFIQNLKSYGHQVYVVDSVEQPLEIVKSFLDAAKRIQNENL